MNLSFSENFSTADNSDKVIATKLEENRKRLELLSIAACAENLPKLEAGMLNTADLEPQTLVANIRSPFMCDHSHQSFVLQIAWIS